MRLWSLLGALVLGLLAALIPFLSIADEAVKGSKITGYKDVRLGASWTELERTRSFLETQVPTEYQLEGIERMSISGNIFEFKMFIKINGDSVESVLLQASSGDYWTQDQTRQILSQQDIQDLRYDLLAVLTEKYPDLIHTETSEALTRPGATHLISRKRKAPVPVGTKQSDLFVDSGANAIELTVMAADPAVATDSGLVDLGGIIVPSTWSQLSIRYFHNPEVSNARDSL